MPTDTPTALVPHARVQSRIWVVRKQTVLLDSDLAELYGLETRALVQAVKRNPDRLPADFMFQLSKEEWDHMRSQTVIASGPGGRRTPPYAFTEQGVAMLSGVLRSPKAVQVNIEIMRAFVGLRHLLSDHEDLHRKLASLERKVDTKLRQVFQALHQLADGGPPGPPRRRIGYKKVARKK